MFRHLGLKVCSCVSGGRYIEVFCVDSSRVKKMTDKKCKEIDRNFTRKLKEDEEEEDVAETGRLFVRNLPYTCTEEEFKELFTKHGKKHKLLEHNLLNIFSFRKMNSLLSLNVTGPLSEVLFPIDNLTKKPKGFAFVTYMIPENAVRALAELDGHIFQVFISDSWIYLCTDLFQ